jgi:plasmid stabilization system protein ParE
VNLRLTPAAEADVKGVHAWFRDRGHDLDDRFFQALDQCLDAIERNPFAFAVVHRDIRRALLRQFPYCIFYVVSGQEIVVLACIHGDRDSETWKNRRDA